MVLAVDEAERRAGISYSTNVLHGDPNYPDQQAQSSIDFKLETSDIQSTLQPAHKGIVYTYTTPRSVHEYDQPEYSPQNWYFNSQKTPTQRPVQFRQKMPQAYSPTPYTLSKGLQINPTYSPTPYTQAKSVQSNPTYSQSQSFNVGYSVKFGNERGKTYKAPRVESDIITGSRKEEVKKPAGEQLSDSTNYNIFLGAKKQKISGIKPKYTKFSSTTPSYNNQIISQSHVTPKTQQQLAFLEGIRGDNKFQKDIEQSVQSSLQSSAGTPWHSLSPSVEIFRSQEVNVQQPRHGSFDHQKALGKSEGFDYTNAVDYTGLQSANQLQQYVQQPASISLPQLSNPLALHQGQYNVQPQLLSFLSQSANHPQSLPLVAEPKIPAHIPKLPMDTSLLRDPFLTVQKQTLASDTKQIPIHFDTSLIQEIGKQYSNLYEETRSTAPSYTAQTESFKIEAADTHEPSPTPEAMNQFNFQHFNNLLAEQNKNMPQKLHQQQSASENSFVKSNDPLGIFLQGNTKSHDKGHDIKFGYPQNGLFNPSVQKMPHSHKYHPSKKEYHRLNKPTAYMVKENVEESMPVQTQFKVFSKPSNGYMRHEYEKRHKVRLEKNVAPRQPRISPKRTIRDYSIETDLKPPPMPFSSRPRRMHKH